MEKLALPAIAALFIACAPVGPDRSVTRLVTLSDRMESPDEALWRDAWDSLTLGSGRTAEADGWVLHRWRDGEIDAEKRREKDIVRVSGHDDDDKLIHAAWTRLTTTPGIHVDSVQLSMLHGHATLRGRMSSRETASSAVRLVASTQGVLAVKSFLVWGDRDDMPPAR